MTLCAVTPVKYLHMKEGNIQINDSLILNHLCNKYSVEAGKPQFYTN